MTTTVQLTGITKRYRGTTALDGVDLSFRPGITGLLGPNGAGKTTLLRIIATVLAPDEGGVRLLGRSPDDPRALAEVRRQLGYLPQEMGFPRGFTGFAFVDYMAVLKEWTERGSRHDEVRRVLGLVDLADVATKRVRALSGGQRRRVALAQALLGDPALLLLDEPTTGVDPQQRVSLRRVLSAGRGDARRSCCPPTRPRTSPRCASASWSSTGDGSGSTAPSPTSSRPPPGRVWLADAPDPAARASWRTGTGRHRNVGDSRATRRRAGRADPRGRVPAAASATALSLRAVAA